MSLADTETAMRPNGAAGPPAMPSPAPPSETLPATPAAAAEADAVAAKAFARPISNFAGTERRVLNLAELVALKAEARRWVEGSILSQYEIAKRLDIRPSLLSTWKRQEGWTRPPGAPVRPLFSGNGPGAAAGVADKAETRRVRMIGRLYRVFDRQAGDLEARAARPNTTTDEKDARTLSVLAKTLETLIALDRDDGAKTEEPEPADRERFNADLARRIRRWAESGE